MQAIDRIAKGYEVLSNYYRYPHSLIGRTQDNLERISRTRVLVFAAHADDESLGIGSVLSRHRRQRDTVSVVFTTNGRGGSGWMTRRDEAEGTAKRRYQEACNALAVIGIPPDLVYCLGFPDGGLYRYTKECLTDVQMLISKIRPEYIYVHSLDGGHVDHDVTNVVVRLSCQQQGFTNAFEWAEYNTFSKPEDPYFVLPGDSEASHIIPTAEDHRFKQEMLDRYLSQSHILKRYRHKLESIRQMGLDDIRFVPTLYPPGVLNRAVRAIRTI